MEARDKSAVPCPHRPAQSGDREEVMQQLGAVPDFAADYAARDER